MPVYWLLGLLETRSLIFLIKNSSDQVEGYLDYLQPPVFFIQVLNATFTLVPILTGVATRTQGGPRSTSGVIAVLAGGLVNLISKLQPTVAVLSSMEAE
jgi:hypothetical protein